MDSKIKQNACQWVSKMLIEKSRNFWVLLFWFLLKTKTKTRKEDYDKYRGGGRSAYQFLLVLNCLLDQFRTDTESPCPHLRERGVASNSAAPQKRILQGEFIVYRFQIFWAMRNSKKVQLFHLVNKKTEVRKSIVARSSSAICCPVFQ